MNGRLILALAALGLVSACVPAVAGGEPAPGERVNVLPPEWTPTPTLQAGQVPETAGTFYCSTAPPSHLEAGDVVSLGEVHAAGRLLAEPGLGQEQVGLVIPGEALEIIKGPECADHMVWWKVRSQDSGLEGWMPEGNQFGRWLVTEEAQDS